MQSRIVFWLLAGIALVHAVASCILQKGFPAIVVGDIAPMLGGAIGVYAMARNTWRAQGVVRVFWGLLGLGCLMWMFNQGAWTWYEVIVRKPLPEPFYADPVIFLHIAPFIAAVGLLPQLPEESRKLYFSTFNTVILTVWWLFVYMFVVVPDQYVVFNAKRYGASFDHLYLIENLIFMGVLVVSVWATHAHWRKLYLHMFWATVFYTLGSFWLNVAIDKGKYYSGSLYDIPYIAAVCWFAWIGVFGGTLPLANEAPSPRTQEWIKLSPRLTMLAVLSLPLFGGWTLLWDGSASELRRFRLELTMIFMIVLGICVFFKQYLLDRALLNMVEVEQRNNEQLKRLQGQLVQKEKLASLGQLVAGAAHEINNPLTAILGYSEMLSSDPAVSANAQQIAQKIAQQARRTGHLVADLQSFSQTTASERALVDVASLVNRALQMQTPRTEGKNIRVEADLEPGLPRLWGNANGLFQAFSHIAENACDALEENGGGSLYVRLRRTASDVVLDFADTGKGIRDPQRVFDPFYTTKAVGQGTGLGLSAAYGIIQEHGGEISCSNRAEGGAVFTVRLPLTSGHAQAAANIAG